MLVWPECRVITESLETPATGAGNREHLARVARVARPTSAKRRALPMRACAPSKGRKPGETGETGEPGELADSRCLGWATASGSRGGRRSAAFQERLCHLLGESRFACAPRALGRWASAAPTVLASNATRERRPRGARRWTSCGRRGWPTTRGEKASFARDSTLASRLVSGRVSGRASGLVSSLASSLASGLAWELVRDLVSTMTSASTRGPAWPLAAESAADPLAR